MKIIKKIALAAGVCLLILAMFAYNSLFSPFIQPPHIGQGLPSNFQAADQEFKQRVENLLNTRMSIENLTAELEQQGFNVFESSQYALFEKPYFPCTLIWRIRWDDNSGIATNLFAKYGGSCL